MTPEDPGPRAADVLVLFGITGDLARKLVLPALYQLVAGGELTVPVVGVALTDLDTDGLRRHAERAGRRHDRPRSTGQDAGLVHLVSGDYAVPAVFTCLAEAVATQAGPEGFAVHYLVPPSLFGTVDGIAAVGLAERSRLVVEKPFGRDLASARALDARPRRHYPEDRVFRVDHFLEPVEDLLVLRFANTLLEPLCPAVDRPLSRSRWPRTSTSPTGVCSTTPSGRSATSCRTTCCRCSPTC